MRNETCETCETFQACQNVGIILQDHTRQDTIPSQQVLPDIEVAILRSEKRRKGITWTLSNCIDLGLGSIEHITPMEAFGSNVLFHEHGSFQSSFNSTRGHIPLLSTRVHASLTNAYVAKASALYHLYIHAHRLALIPLW